MRWPGGTRHSRIASHAVHETRVTPNYDVFVENYGPGVVEKLDIGPDVVQRANPRIIYGRLKGFGLSGPYAQFKSLDPIALTGPDDAPPVYPASMTGDSGTGLQLALAITAAYVECQRTGAGQVIEISMQEAMTFFMRSRASSTIWNTRPALGRGDPGRSGARPATVPMYPCRPQGLNDYVFIMCSTERMWNSLCGAIEQPELARDPRFATAAARREHNEALAEVIGAWMLGRTKEEAMLILGEAGVPCSAILGTEDLFTDPHLRERGFIQQVDHPEHGEVELLGFAPRLSNGDVPFVRAPLMGEGAHGRRAAGRSGPGAGRDYRSPRRRRRGVEQALPGGCAPVSIPRPRCPRQSRS